MLLGMQWGWSAGASLVFGLSLSVASTVVLMRSLEKLGVLQSVNGRIAMGWLIVEDMAMVLVLVLLPSLAGSGSGDGDGSVLRALLLTLLQVTAFIAVMQLVGRRVFPWLLEHVAGTHSRELFTLTVIAVAVGIAYGSSVLFGVSLALGAFFAGMMMRESPLSHRAANESLPLRDAFCVLFFVSVGMLFDPGVVLERPLQVLAVVLVIFGKALTAFLLVLAFRYPLNTALTVAASLAQIGEFSFILVGLGVDLGLLSEEARNLVLAGSLISISLNSFLFRAIEPAQAWIRSRSQLARLVERPDDPLAELPMTVKSAEVTGHVIIVGYGSVGQRIGKTLEAKHVSFVVAEQNREVVERLRKQGFRAVAGDASDPAVLIQAHIARASVLIVTYSDLFRARRMVEVARMLNPPVTILLRTASAEEAALATAEKLGTAFLSEYELADNMTSKALASLKGHEAGH
jgi:CPA2 family monovalent cation:H+ antiporter-2